MGLDMYLRATRYVSGYDFIKDAAEKKKYRDLLKLMDASDFVDPETPSAAVSVNVAYWRKANQIHQWFVDNAQGGIDDCKDYYVSREQLTELRDTCQRVLDSLELQRGRVHTGTTYTAEGAVEEHWTDGDVAGNTKLAEELLPSQEGFFFGGTEYDEYYAETLKYTITQLDRVLAIPKDWDFEYRASW